jgi:hypothetical protein
MKCAESSILTLKPFASWNDHFVVIPPRRFIVFGEGKGGALRGIAVEGYLNETFETPTAYSFAEFMKGVYSPAATKFDPVRKVSFFDELSAATAITSFNMGSDELKALRKVDARRFTHVRFFKKPSGVTNARLFDARKYYASSVSDRDVVNYCEIQMTTDAASDFHFYMELSVLKQLPLDDYDIVVLDNEMVIFEGIESGLTFHTRDQRLGEQMEERISDLGSYDELFLIDPVRVQPTRNDWNAPAAQRR